jgi:AraC family transcriptional regulator of arabinose operon
VDCQIYSCGYSYHMKPFSTGDRDPLGEYLFRLQSEGTSKAYIDKQMRTINSGELLLFKPGDLYELRIEHDEQGELGSGDYYIMCGGKWIEEWWERTERPTVVNVGLDDRIVTIWKHLIVEQRRSRTQWSELGGVLLQSLCLYFDRAFKETVAEPKYGFTVYRMKRYIEEQATHSFKVEDVARHVDLSSSRAAHLFKEAFGESIMQYALKVRLNIAVERMKYSKLTLEQISDICGLGSYPYFHRVFKEAYGESPSVYRRKWASDLTGHGAEAENQGSYS